MGCNTRVSQTPPDTGVILLPTALRDYDPRLVIGSWDVKVSNLIVPGLFSVDNQELAPKPALAARIEETGDLTWDVVLRPDLLFSDGTPLKATDVAYTFLSAMAPDSNSMAKGAFEERFASIEVIDELRIRFRLKKPVATLLSDFTFGIVSEAGDKRGEVIGAGPYRVVEFSSERVRLEANPYYRGPKPELKKLDLRVVRDANARALMLVGGTGDFTQNGVRIDLVNEIAKRKRLRVKSGPSNILTYLMMQNDDEILQDVRVRRAIAHSIDRRKIISAKFHGYARLASGFLPAGHWAENSDIPKYEFDQAKARALLDEAGYTDPDGVGGAPRFTLSYKTSADQFRLTLARIIAEQLGQVGIAVEVRSFEFGTFFADIKKGNFQLASMQTGSVVEPDYYYTFFHSGRIPSVEAPHGKNRWHFRSERLDSLTENGRTVMGQEKRKPLYGEVQQILAEEVPVVPLWHEDNIAVVNKTLSGYRVGMSASLNGLAVSKKQK